MPEVLNSIFYLLRSGCAWRILPHNLPLLRTVYGYFRNSRRDGVCEAMNDALRACPYLGRWWLLGATND